MELADFDWGWMNKPTSQKINGEDASFYHKRELTRELFEERIYEKEFKVNEGDVILDIGSSVGPFTYSILEKNPSKVICVEPSSMELPTLNKNVGSYPNVSIETSAIWDTDGKVTLKDIFTPSGDPIEVDAIKFTTLIDKYNLGVVDFMKIDCEGGEYEVFNVENMVWIKENLRKIAGEWHLSTPELKEKFRAFRDVFLRLFPNHSVYSFDGVDIKWDLWNEHFIEYYKHILIYIDNR